MKPECKNIIGLRVSVARKRIGVTQADLSERLTKTGISIGRPGIAKIETDLRPVKDYELVGLAKALGASVNWLLRGRE